MREILFRGKRTATSEWVEGNLVWIKNYEEQPYQCFIISQLSYLEYGEFDEIYQVFPETLCQFTGLHDKNGKRIWENDIVRELDYMPRVAVVKFGKGYYDGGIYPFVGWYYQYSNDDDIDGQALYESVAREGFEVIGNSIDNPELLTAERIDENEN